MQKIWAGTFRQREQAKSSGRSQSDAWLGSQRLRGQWVELGEGPPCRLPGSQGSS